MARATTHALTIAELLTVDLFQAFVALVLLWEAYRDQFMALALLGFLA